MLLDLANRVWPPNLDPGAFVTLSSTDLQRVIMAVAPLDRVSLDSAPLTNTMQINNTKTIRLTVRLDGVLSDPSAVTFSVWAPGADPQGLATNTWVLGTDAELRSVSTGVVEADVDVGAESGLWLYAWDIANPDGYREGHFSVDRSFSAP